MGAGVVERAEDAALDGLGGQPDADLQPRPAAAGPVSMGEAFDDYAFDSSFAVVAHPGAGDGETGGHRHQHEAGRELSAQEVLEEGRQAADGFRADVGAREGEDVERYVGDWQCAGQLLSPCLTGVKATLQGGEVDPSLVPEDELYIEHHVDIELGDGGDDLGEDLVSDRHWRDCRATVPRLRRAMQRLVD